MFERITAISRLDRRLAVPLFFALYLIGSAQKTLSSYLTRDGLFNSTQGLLTTGHASLFITQLLGALTVIVWGFVSGALIANMCDSTVGLRATEREEEEGLDMAYHGIPAYNELERFADLPSGLYDFEETTGIRVAPLNKKNAVG